MSMRMLSLGLAGVVAMGALVAGCDPGLQTGQVLFTTDNTIDRMGGCTYLNGVAQGCDHGGSDIACSVALAVSSVPAGNDVYAVYVLTGRGGPSVNGHTDAVVTVTRNGVPYLQRPGGSVDSGSAGYIINIQPTYDCLYDPANEAWSLPSGKYHFQVSLEGQILSQGDLTVD
jgi:hypothetical protein